MAVVIHQAEASALRLACFMLLLSTLLPFGKCRAEVTHNNCDQRWFSSRKKKTKKTKTQYEGVRKCYSRREFTLQLKTSKNARPNCADRLRRSPPPPCDCPLHYFIMTKRSRVEILPLLNLNASIINSERAAKKILKASRWLAL